jgi:F-box/leucine-rich repeat protein 7
MHPSTVTSIPLFASVPRRRRELVARLADEIEVPAGFQLTSQNGHAREFFVVVSGTAAVYRDGERVGALASGDFFGEVALLGKGWTRTATVVATSSMRLLVLARREFRELLAHFPAIAAPIAHAATERA